MDIYTVYPNKVLKSPSGSTDKYSIYEEDTCSVDNIFVYILPKMAR